MATLEIPVEYIAFAHEAQTNQAAYPDAKAWARDYARKFYHEISNTPGFLPIYKTLLAMSASAASLAQPSVSAFPEGKTPIAYPPGKAQALAKGKTPVAQTKAKTHPTFETSFNEQFENALLSIESYDDLNLWARAEATRMYWVFERQTKWKVLYDAIFDRAMGIIHTHTENTQVSNAASTSPSVFAEDNAPTDAEEKAGRNQLNQVLYKEFDLWWDAFQAEAEEDTDKKAPSAEDRFSWHAAKVLSKKTDLPVDDLVPVVGAWLQGRLAAE